MTHTAPQTTADLPVLVDEADYYAEMYAAHEPVVGDLGDELFVLSEATDAELDAHIARLQNDRRLADEDTGFYRLGDRLEVAYDERDARRLDAADIAASFPTVLAVRVENIADYFLRVWAGAVQVGGLVNAADYSRPVPLTLRG